MCCSVGKVFFSRRSTLCRGMNRSAFVLLLLILLFSPVDPAKKKTKNSDEFLKLESNLQEGLAHENNAVNLANSGQYNEAMEEFKAAISKLREAGEEIRPVADVLGRVYTFMGHIHTLLGKLPLGLKFWKKGLKYNPSLTDARQNIIKSLSDQGEHQQALEYARGGVGFQPALPEAHVQVGDACRNLKNFSCAMQAYNKALAMDPKHFNALFSLAVAHRDLMEDRPALELFERAQVINPASSSVVNALAVVRGDTCLWSSPDFSEDGKHNSLVQVARSTPQAEEQRQASPIHPLLLAYHLDDPILLSDVAASHAREAAREAAIATGRAAVNHPDHQAAAAASAQTAPTTQLFTFKHLPTVSLAPGNDVKARRRLRVGYLTADIHDHPTALLVQGMFGTQRAGGEVEVWMYSYGVDDGSVYRSSIRTECEHFAELHKAPFIEMAKRINEDAIHVLVDMKQHTESHALNVIALKPAPVQIAWLGFPGGIGGNLAQYIVGDAIVSPPDHASFFPEGLALLPPQISYQVNNYQNDPFIGANSQPLPPDVEPDVPAARTVFTSLNHPRKIKPRRFQSYISILAAVDNSSLSLLSRHETTGANLKREAHKLGVDPERIHIAKVLGKAAHMLRFRRSSLFLDTFPYAAHTTCSEALFAGLPVLTRPGQTFASRVPASLLHALGLRGATVVVTEDEFVELGVRIGGGGKSAAKDSSKGSGVNKVRKRLKGMMKRARTSSVLFKHEVWVAHWTRLLKMMWDAHKSGKKRRNIVGHFVSA